MKVSKYFGILLFVVTGILLLGFILPHVADTRSLQKEGGTGDYVYDIFAKGIIPSVVVGGLGTISGFLFCRAGKQGIAIRGALLVAMVLQASALLLLLIPPFDLLIRLACGEEDLLWPYILFLLLSVPAVTLFAAGLVFALVAVRADRLSRVGSGSAAMEKGAGVPRRGSRNVP